MEPTNPTMTDRRPGPLIFILELERRSGLFWLLYDIFHVEGYSNIDNAVDDIRAKNPKAVLVTDEGLTHRQREYTFQAFREYVDQGGTMIFGDDFPRNCDKELTDNMFREMFDLRWQIGRVADEEVEYNDNCILPDGLSFNTRLFPRSWLIESKCMTNVNPEHRILRPVHLCNGTESVNDTTSPVAGARFGHGYVAYFGNWWLQLDCSVILSRLCGI